MAIAQRGMPTTEQPGEDVSVTPASTKSDVRFEAVAVTDIGRQRKHNEDFVLLKPELDLFVVADGMGGHNAGDIASKLATASIHNFYEALQDGAEPEKVLKEGYDDLSKDAKHLAAGIRKANRDVFEISNQYRQHHGMGSTIVACYLARAKGMMHVGHVGDSRCYRFRDGEIAQLTHDHSLVNDALALKPDLTPEEVARLPKNIITRALGMRDDVKVDIRSERVHEGDVFLLCSDGLSGLIGESDMTDVIGAMALEEDGDLRDACERLVTMANDAGGNDNITALLIRIDSVSAVPDDSPEKDDGPVATASTGRLNTAELEALAREDTGEVEVKAAPVLVECPACEEQVDSKNKFCTECGATLEAEP